MSFLMNQSSLEIRPIVQAAADLEPTYFGLAHLFRMGADSHEGRNMPALRDSLYGDARCLFAASFVGQFGS